MVSYGKGSTRKKMVLLRQQKKGQQMNFCCSTENFAAATERFVDRTYKHFVFLTKYFDYPYFNK